MGFLAKLFGKRLVDDVDFKALLESGSRVIDVRNVGEYKEGHGKNALNFPLTTLSQNMNTLKSLNGPLIVVCKSGNRSQSAVKKLRKNGIEAYNAGAWNNI